MAEEAEMKQPVEIGGNPEEGGVWVDELSERVSKKTDKPRSVLSPLQIKIDKIGIMMLLPPLQGYCGD